MSSLSWLELRQDTGGPSRLQGLLRSRPEPPPHGWRGRV